MEVLAYLAPISFVFALAAISQVTSLKKDLEELKDNVEELRMNQTGKNV